MKVSTSLITFRIDIDFPGCEVDMVLKEMMSRGVRTPVPSILCDSSKIPIDQKKLPKTPTEASVDFALHWLAGYVDRNEMCISNGKWETDFSKPSFTAYTDCGMAYTTWPKVQTELEQIGIEVKEWYGLMQGTCHLICEVELSKFKPEIIGQAEQIVHTVFKKLVKYYKVKKKKAA